jgi:hypothetical protein
MPYLARPSFSPSHMPFPQPAALIPAAPHSAATAPSPATRGPRQRVTAPDERSCEVKKTTRICWSPGPVLGFNFGVASKSFNFWLGIFGVQFWWVWRFSGGGKTCEKTQGEILKPSYFWLIKLWSPFVRSWNSSCKVRPPKDSCEITKLVEQQIGSLLGLWLQRSS